MRSKAGSHPDSPEGCPQELPGSGCSQVILHQNFVYQNLPLREMRTTAGSHPQSSRSLRPGSSLSNPPRGCSPRQPTKSYSNWLDSPNAGFALPTFQRSVEPAPDNHWCYSTSSPLHWSRLRWTYSFPQIHNSRLGQHLSHCCSL